MKFQFLAAAIAVLLAACASAPTGNAPPAPPQAGQPADASPPATAPAGAPSFTTQAKWERAGYNDDEIVYTILITSQDSRILRCTTHMQGYYFSDGKKTAITDQQLSTVFPAQQVSAGIWLDMDEASGATYEVKCKPV